MSTVGDVLSNEVSHIGNLAHQMVDNPLKSLAQGALGAADPFGAKLWSGITGAKLTPLVGQMGGETDAQYAQSRAQGVNTGPSQMLGHVADAVAAIWGSYGLASGGAGAAAGAGGDAGAAGGAAADGSTLPADVSVGTTGAGGTTASASTGGSSLLGNLSLAQKAELGMSALSLAKTAMTPSPSLGTAATPTQMPNGPESQGANAAQAMMAGTGQAGGAPGVAQTLLTGAGGVDPSSLGLGKNTLLGG